MEQMELDLFHQDMKTEKIITEKLKRLNRRLNKRQQTLKEKQLYAKL